MSFIRTTYNKHKNFIINLSGFRNERAGFSKALSIVTTDHLTSMLKVKKEEQGWTRTKCCLMCIQKPVEAM